MRGRNDLLARKTVWAADGPILLLENWGPGGDALPLSQFRFQISDRIPTRTASQQEQHPNKNKSRAAQFAGTPGEGETLLGALHDSNTEPQSS